MTRPEYSASPYRLNAGRIIELNGIHVATLHRCKGVGEGYGYTMSPYAMDEFAALIVRALNEYQGNSDIIVIKQAKGK